jgi:hypothetical protein
VTRCKKGENEEKGQKIKKCINILLHWTLSVDLALYMPSMVRDPLYLGPVWIQEAKD